jgi:CRISPR/Cas system CSM-associated protein Csm3 (group 7 of RAMP superfamily)
MPTVTINIPLTIHVNGPLHIGTGYGQGLLNRTIVKTRHGHVYIPGSSIRGVLRDKCEQLARSLGLKACSSPRPQDMCSDQNSLCIVCRLFGSPGGDSRLIVDDAHLRDDLREALSLRAGPAARAVPFGQTTRRTQVQLSRLRGLAREARLFSSEFGAEGLVFQTSIGGTLELNPVEPDQEDSIEGQYVELILLLSAIKMVTHLGGGRRRGAGACRLALPDKIEARRHGGQSREVEVQRLLNMAEWLELYEEPR